MCTNPKFGTKFGRLFKRKFGCIEYELLPNFRVVHIVLYTSKLSSKKPSELLPNLGVVHIVFYYSCEFSSVKPSEFSSEFRCCTHCILYFLIFFRKSTEYNVFSELFLFLNSFYVRLYWNTFSVFFL